MLLPVGPACVFVVSAHPTPAAPHPACTALLPCCRADRAQRRLDSGKNVKSTPEQLWQAQHEAAADHLFKMLADLKGFYLKLGQILATKTDMLPASYTASLSRLLDRMPATPFSKVRALVNLRFCRNELRMKESGLLLGNVVCMGGCSCRTAVQGSAAHCSRPDDDLCSR